MEILLELFENERGFLTVRISGNGTFNLTYPGTTAHQIASYFTTIYNSWNFLNSHYFRVFFHSERKTCKS